MACCPRVERSRGRAATVQPWAGLPNPFRIARRVILLCFGFRPSDFTFPSRRAAGHPNAHLDGSRQRGYLTSMSVATIQTEVLALPPGERAKLIDVLWDSLASPEVTSREAVWAEESERRIDAFEAGKLKARDAGTVFSDLRKTPSASSHDQNSNATSLTSCKTPTG